MKIKSVFIASVLVLTCVAHSQVVIVSENFDSLTAPALPSSLIGNNNVSTVDDVTTALSGTVSLWIVESRSSNYWTTTALGLSSGVTTESTISFDWTDATTYASAFGRLPQIQWSNDGSTFFSVSQLSLPSSNDGSVNWQSFSTTVTDGQTFGANTVSFSADSAWRVTGDNDAGGGGAPLVVDNLSITADAIPEPSSALLIGLGSLALFLLRRRR